MMKVTEIFKSVQGEGFYIGTPMTFIRFSGCNLRCYYCDTKYALTEGAPMSCINIIKRVKSLGCKHVCITGGEPLVQDQDELYRLTDELDYRKYVLHIETNGTIYPQVCLYDTITVWTVSPKLSNSGMEKYLSPDIVDDIIDYATEVQLKFVIQKKDDVIEANEFIESLTHANRPDLEVIFQPEVHLYWDDYAKGLRHIYTWASKVVDRPYRVLPQLHFLMWRGKRGR